MASIAAFSRSPTWKVPSVLPSTSNEVTFGNKVGDFYEGKFLAIVCRSRSGEERSLESITMLLKVFSKHKSAGNHRFVPITALSRLLLCSNTMLIAFQRSSGFCRVTNDANYYFQEAGK